VIIIIIILYYAKRQHNHYKYSIQSIKPQKEEKRKKLVRKSGKTVKLSIQTLQMLHCVSNITMNKTFKKAGKTVTQNIQCTMLTYCHHHHLLSQ